ncbi:MAG: D-glycero-beta-D-manno-heptose-7-phosphate kinase [Endomicrobiaceae bacterium]|nr:D-glycero-beta-D-manno-heptose-7-phosphate kinase [Endomicrobiaceae bacterium]
MQDKLLSMIPKLKKQSILVVGDTMVDKFIWGKVSRISPEAPVPVVEVSSDTETLGGAGNVASNITSLGATAYLITVMGDDINGVNMKNMLKEKNINHDFVVVDKNRPTTIKTRIIASHQQVVRVDREVKGTFSPLTEKNIIKNIETVIPKVGAIIISDYAKGIVVPKVLKKIIALAKKRNIPVTVDPKVENFKQYKHITCMTPNAKEATEGMNAKNINTDEDIALLGKKIIKLLNSESILITRGEKGMTLIEKNNKITHIPTRAKEVYDVTGAGDTVIATMTLALSAKFNFVASAEIANFAAGLVVAKVGTATITTKELEETIKDFYRKK